jgi:DNA-binding GntR family transcriptional regulator
LLIAPTEQIRLTGHEHGSTESEWERDGAQEVSESVAAVGVANRPSLVDGAEGALRNWLAPGRYRQGDRLPPEHEVAAMLGVSRGTLRSALQRLERSGEIVRRQGSGTFVGRMSFPTAFGERLERLEPYSSVARRRGLTLVAIDLEIEQRAVEQEAAEALGLAAGVETTTITRTLLAGGSAVATMYDVVHPDVQLPETEQLRARLLEGQMVLDVLIEVGVPITFARTRVMPALVSGRERAGKRLGIQGTTACLELEELIFASSEVRVA